MDPRPSVVGLTLCDRIIVDQLTGQPSLIGIFTDLRADGFPSPPTRFSAYAVLTGGVGGGIIELRAVHLASGDQVYARRGWIQFPDRTDIVSVLLRTESIVFPSPGFYLFQLVVDGEVIEGAQRRIQLHRKRGEP